MIINFWVPKRSLTNWCVHTYNPRIVSSAQQGPSDVLTPLLVGSPVGTPNKNLFKISRFAHAPYVKGPTRIFSMVPQKLTF